MGRIRTSAVKKVTQKLVGLYGDRLTDNFAENKRVISQLIYTPSPKLKNYIAGYATKLVKKSRSRSKSTSAGEDFTLQQF
ncbi:30S ribosomal protein S17e [Candidatus Woesearchaeota archaeon]|nr:30S ribosomal protein S17e [Candidatus Woesearchaeota archaeon]